MNKTVRNNNSELNFVDLIYNSVIFGEYLFYLLIIFFLIFFLCCCRKNYLIKKRGIIIFIIIFLFLIEFFTRIIKGILVIIFLSLGIDVSAIVTCIIGCLGYTPLM
jgi:hypothetical protein